MNCREQVKHCDTPAEMRAELFRLSHYEALVRRCCTAADAYGLSGEDRYTMIAYHAVKQMLLYQEQFLDVMTTMPPPPMAIKP